MIVKKRLDTYADVEEQVSLKTRTTFRIGGNCRYFIYPKNEICFLRILQNFKRRKYFLEDLEKEVIFYAVTMTLMAL